MVVAEFGRSSHLLSVALFANRPIFDDRQWDLLADGLNRLGKIAAGAGMRLCYHHHMGTGVMTRADVDRLMASTDPDLVHLLLDTGHMAFAGDDPIAAARDYAHRIKHVHLKDIRPEIVSRVREEGLSFQRASRRAYSPCPGTA